MAIHNHYSHQHNRISSGSDYLAACELIIDRLTTERFASLITAKLH